MSQMSSSLPATSDPSGASFGCSADGMPVALIGDHAYAMAPGRDGRHFLVSGWRIARPMSEWTRADFYGHAAALADEAAFRAKVAEQAEHAREKMRLGRRNIGGGANTPWGVSQGGTVYADGVTAHSTAGHGGFKLSADHNRKVHPMLRSAGGWYEEDAAWAIVAITFPHLFTGVERRCAERTAKDSWPDAWETTLRHHPRARRIPRERPPRVRGGARRRLDRGLGDHLGSGEGLRRMRRHPGRPTRRRH